MMKITLYVASNAIKSSIILIVVFHMVCTVAAETFNVDDFGAVGDGETMNTSAIQKAINLCHAQGGGKVVFNAGKYVTGTIYLKSNVTLHIGEGVVLLGSSEVNDFPDQKSPLPIYDRHTLTSKALIYSENQNNISVTGLGVINGRGAEIDLKMNRTSYQSPSFRYRPRIIHLRSCNQVLIEGVTLINAAAWVQTYHECKNVRIRAIRVDSRENSELSTLNNDELHMLNIEQKKPIHRNTDGLDIVDCRFVWISDSYINAGDDAIVIKSFSPDKEASNILISDCHLTSHASGIKIGTETAGRITDVVVQNCTVFDTRGSGIAIMTVDGATVQRINVSNIVLRNIKASPIFIRLHTRNRTYGNYDYVNKPQLKNVIIDNVQGSELSDVGCSISGIAGYPIENVTISRVNFEFDGSGEIDAPETVREIVSGYPKGRMFGPFLPAYGFYVRHANNVTFDNITLKSKKTDSRPALVAELSESIHLNQFSGPVNTNSKHVVRFTDVQRSSVGNVSVDGESPFFMFLTGKNSKDINLSNFLFGDEMKPFHVGSGLGSDRITIR